MTPRKTCIALALIAATSGLTRVLAADAPPAPDAAPAPPPAPRVPFYDVTYLYSLSTNFGPVPVSNAQLSYDREHHELFVSGDGPVRVFNESGMETFTFGEDPEIGFIVSIASTEDGDLVALTAREGRMALVRLSFRGELRGAIQPQGLPEDYAQFQPSIMRYANGKLYLADLGGMRIVVLEPSGAYVASYDVAEKLGEAKKRGDLGLRGFNVDREGNMLFTIQPLFRAYSMSPEGEIHAFGQKGSAPGKFNIVGGIARDDAGNYYVADILKSAVIIFDREFAYRKEFGYRGPKPGNLAAPEDLAASGDRLFVSQRARKGVSVFQVVAR
jgi:hypothetical protein